MLETDTPLAALLCNKHSEAVTEAFGENNMEARVWVAAVRVCVIASQMHLQLVAAEAESSAQASASQLPAIEAPEYQVSSVNTNQSAVANEIIQRMLIAKGAGP